jgi:hypothetical protein
MEAEWDTEEEYLSSPQTFTWVPPNRVKTPVISGVGDKTGYITVGITMPSGQGTYELLIDHVCKPDKELVAYYYYHTGAHLDLYMIAAILLAVSVLVDDPSDLEGAARAMLKASDIVPDIKR